MRCIAKTTSKIDTADTIQTKKMHPAAAARSRKTCNPSDQLSIVVFPLPPSCSGKPRGKQSTSCSSMVHLRPEKWPGNRKRRTSPSQLQGGVGKNFLQSAITKTCSGPATEWKDLAWSYLCSSPPPPKTKVGGGGWENA